jgi:hypothetical protein
LVRNTSTPGALSFGARTDVVLPRYFPENLAIGDLDDDGFNDVAVAYYVFPSPEPPTLRLLSVCRNTSSPGTISLNTPQQYSVQPGRRSNAIADLNGDGKPELVDVGQYSGAIMRKNISVPGNIVFPPLFYNEYSVATSSTHIVLSDLDGDSRPDLAAPSGSTPWIYVRRNAAGDVLKFCPNGTINLSSNFTGSSYQWQVSTDSVNYTNIANGTNYINVSGASLTINTLPSAWSGYRYRCVVDGSRYSDIFTIFSENRWVGGFAGSDNNWENPDNWSCGTVPDMHTSVLIASGNPTINSNTTVRGVVTRPGAGITVMPGVVLTVLR